MARTRVRTWTWDVGTQKFTHPGGAGGADYKAIAPKLCQTQPIVPVGCKDVDTVYVRQNCAMLWVAKILQRLTVMSGFRW